MKRRAFLGAALAAPAAIAGTVHAKEFVVPASSAGGWRPQLEAMKGPIRGDYAFARGGSTFAIGWDYQESETPAALVEVIDLDTGMRVDHVLWCNAATGQLERIAGLDYDKGQFRVERVSGNFAINRRRG